MSTFIRLIDYDSALQKEREFFNIRNIFEINQNRLKKIDSAPIAYWADKIFNVFNNTPLEYYVTPRAGMITSANSLFVRLWYEPSNSKIGFGIKNIANSVRKRA